MYKDFEQMPDNSKIWVYQSGRMLSLKEVEIITLETRKFIDQWTAHNMALQASCKILHDHFLVICVDEATTSASGCSIDALFRYVKSLEGSTGISFLNRTEVAIEIAGEIQISTLNDIPGLVSKKVITPDTIIFNNTIQQKFEIGTIWRMKASESWLKRYFIKENEIIVSNT